MEKNVQNIKQGDFEREVLKSNVTTVVDFYADWCGPCRMVSPVIEKLSADYDGKVKFVKVDTDANQDIAMKYSIMSIPTVMIFKDGKARDVIIGAAPAASYRQRIDKVLGN